MVLYLLANGTLYTLLSQVINRKTLFQRSEDINRKLYRAALAGEFPLTADVILALSRR